MILKTDKFEIEIVPRRTTNSTHYFDVTLISGDWPTDSDLITHCDNRNGSLVVQHFGGVVKTTDSNCRQVAVYVD
jgi:hypothetical protein